MRIALLILCSTLAAFAQTEARGVQRLLEPALVSPEVVSDEIKSYLMGKAQPAVAPASAEAWTATAATLRKRILDEIIFHGWPADWVNAPLKVEDLGEIPGGKGYRMRKLRYEIVPGFFSSAILYLPEKLSGKAPAVLNVNGHVGPEGKAVEYKQKRCINQALQGMISLNLEWLSFGELGHKENVHWFGGHLDLAGANSIGLFYLAMRKGLDYLWEHPQVDRGRLAVTGLSGGGWQTIILSALDERVNVSIPVAGYSAVISRIERPQDIGDIEQNATDLLTLADYSHLTAMRAPKPTLLIYNAEDDCCFRAPLVKPYIFDAIRPFFRLYEKPDNFAWHLNVDPATHNYLLNNRQASYRFLARHFGLPPVERETSVDDQIKSYDELVVGLPKDNLTILGVAKRLASRIERRPDAGSDRLREVVRYRPVEVRRAWAMNNTVNKGLETRGFRFEFSNGLSAAGVWLRALSSDSPATATIVLDDRGKKMAGREVSDRANRGEQVLAADLLFTGDAASASPGPRGYAQMLAAMGDRPLGMEAAQLISLANWLKSANGAAKVRVEANGMRNQVAALVAAAAEPGLFSEVVIRSGIDSLAALVETPVDYLAAPELFCLDLYREFDVNRLVQLTKATVQRR